MFDTGGVEMMERDGGDEGVLSCMRAEATKLVNISPLGARESTSEKAKIKRAVWERQGDIKAKQYTDR